MALPRRLLIVVIVAGVLLVVGAAAAISVFTRQTSHVRDRVVTALNERFRSQVELDTLVADVFPAPAISGTGLRLRHNGRTDVEPLIAVESFTATAGLWDLTTAPPLRLRTVELEGLDIRVPPGGLRAPAPTPNPLDSGLVRTSGESAAPSAAPATPPRRRWLPFRRNQQSPLIIDRLVARRATLEISPRDLTKLPRIFEIHDLTMSGFGGTEGAAFTAGVINPTPFGRIDTEGSFGPWQSEDPRLTPVEGRFVFDKANLHTIKGIGGTLSTRGNYRGVLERIEVSGTGSAPDFVVKLGGHPVPLETEFEAIVDGTNGNTFLERVEAKLAETVVHAKGAVVRQQDVKGRRVSLDVSIDRGRIEDLLTLAVKTARPVITGRIDLKTSFVLPEGDRDVADKLQLDGTFTLAQARFTNIDVQQRLTELSRRGRGDDAPPDGASVVSNLAGRFRLRDARLDFSSLRFGVPGATVQIAGHYDLRSETIDFKGDLLLDATLAETTSGFKAILARLAQPFFRRPGGGSKLPIRISGSRNKPSFGLDIRRALLPG